LDHQEQLVLVLVMVPEELALELDQLDLLAVQLADDLGTPLVLEPGELFADVHFFDRTHGMASGIGGMVVSRPVHAPGFPPAAALARRATNASCSGEARPRSRAANTPAMSSFKSAAGSSHKPRKTLER